MCYYSIGVLNSDFSSERSFLLFSFLFDMSIKACYYFCQEVKNNVTNSIDTSFMSRFDEVIGYEKRVHD